MKKIVAITGYPGSGKSTLAAQYIYKGYRLIDDPSVTLPTMNLMPHLMRETPLLVVTDPWLVSARCRAGFLAMVKEAGLDPVDDVQWIIFEDAPRKCLENILRRAERSKPIGSMAAFVREYSVPEGADVRSVWQPEVN